MPKHDTFQTKLRMVLWITVGLALIVVINAWLSGPSDPFERARLRCESLHGAGTPAAQTCHLRATIDILDEQDRQERRWVTQ